MYKTFINISKLYTLQGGIRTKEKLNEVNIIENAYMKVKDGLIYEIGKMTDLNTDENCIDLHHQIVVPGFVDAHSHLVFAGDRVNEYALKIQGASYMDIYNMGGGIFSTVKKTREASFEELYDKAKQAIYDMVSCGVTTLEAKSGYGLDKECELRQLRVVKKLNEDLPVDLVSTFMPAHALPKEYKEASSYFKMIKEEVLPIVVNENLAEYMDCFLEKGVFNKDEAYEILSYGKEKNLKIKIHVDEIEDIGGVDTAVSLQARSVEHCMVTNETNMKKLAENNIVAVLLPATSFNLQKPFANIRKMIENGVIVALSNDYNPGSSPCTDSIWMARIASRGAKLTPHEVLNMMCINSAKALDLEDKVGSLEVNKQADFIVMNVNSFDEVIAHLGKNPITSVYKKGEKIC